MMEKALLNLKETSEYLGLGESMTRKIMKENLGVFVTRIGNRYYASKILLDKWISNSVKSKDANGDTIVLEISKRLTVEFGKGFNKTALFRMIKFYQEFPDYGIVATLSQQLTWSHFVEVKK